MEGLYAQETVNGLSRMGSPRVCCRDRGQPAATVSRLVFFYSNGRERGRQTFPVVRFPGASSRGMPICVQILDLLTSHTYPGG